MLIVGVVFNVVYRVLRIGSGFIFVIRVWYWVWVCFILVRISKFLMGVFFGKY